jgi:tetratricopeptide (TPR) repeat protein
LSDELTPCKRKCAQLSSMAAGASAFGFAHCTATTWKLHPVKAEMDARCQQAQELRRQIEWKLARAVDPNDVLPMLHRLARMAADGTEESSFAHIHLAELLVERHPWRAALCARRVVAHRDDNRAWATLALCQTILGHYKFGVAAYHRALASAPNNPWYAHNLGHLLDVALDRPRDAVAWLKRAYEGAPQSGEVAASYAHALARAGELIAARRVLTKAMKRSASREHSALLKWLELGAPLDKDHPLPRPAPVHAIAMRGRGDATPARREGPASAGDRREGDRRTPSQARSFRPPSLADLEGILARGMANLPLDARQRARAKALARDAAAYFSPAGAVRNSSRPPRAGGDAIAAAVAYAIVYVDHVPLSQAEVAACFRVGVASLRVRFGELRAYLDLTPGDARYATLRRG